MWKLMIAAAMSVFAHAAAAQSFVASANALQQLYALEDGGWRLKALVRDFDMREVEDQRISSLAGVKSQSDAKQDVPKFEIEQPLIGSFEYHWVAGRQPELGFHGIPARLKLKTDGIYVGFSFRP